MAERENTMRFVMASLFGALSLAAPASADELMRQAQERFQPLPAELPTLEGNPITPEKVELGKILFFDPRMSTSWVFSCNSCHNLGTGGVDLQETSIGHGWQKGPRNAPTVLNGVFNIAQFWDGRAKDLREQATGPLLNPGEMGSSAERALETLNSMPEYVDRFKSAFPGEDDAVSLENLAKSIEAFEATLLTRNAPFDRYLAGDDNALSARQKQGLQLFIESGCASCHDGVNVGGGQYARFGVVEAPDPKIRPPEDKGRLAVTNQPEDEYVFRVAPLRNVALTPPYFHSGQVWSLEEAVKVMAAAQLGLELSDDEAAAISDFLASLTGEQPDISYPTLPPITGETPFPQPIKEVREVEKPTPADRPSK